MSTNLFASIMREDYCLKLVVNLPWSRAHTGSGMRHTKHHISQHFHYDFSLRTANSAISESSKDEPSQLVAAAELRGAVDTGIIVSQ